MSVNQDILTGLKEAMIAERTGIEFYQAAAEKTVDPQGKEVFLRLADEERRHLEYLRRQFENVFNDTSFEPLTEKSKIDLAGASPIFSKGIKEQLKTAHWEMSALAVGLALEQASISRYQELARRADKPDAREFFLALVHWEETHLAALQKQFNYLRESYWEQAGFAPF